MTLSHSNGPREKKEKKLKESTKGRRMCVRSSQRGQVSDLEKVIASLDFTRTVKKPKFKGRCNKGLKRELLRYRGGVLGVDPSRNKVPGPESLERRQMRSQG